eukprot:721803_1
MASCCFYTEDSSCLCTILTSNLWDIFTRYHTQLMRTSIMDQSIQLQVMNHIEFRIHVLFHRSSLRVFGSKDDEIIIGNQFKMQVISGMIKVEQITKRTASNPRVYDASSQYHCIIQFHEFIPPVYPIITVVHVRNVSSMMMDESLVSMLFDQIWGGFDNEICARIAQRFGIQSHQELSQIRKIWDPGIRVRV